MSMSCIIDEAIKEYKRLGGKEDSPLIQKFNDLKVLVQKRTPVTVISYKKNATEEEQKYSKLSNFNAGPVVVDNKKFNTIEHAYQYKKAEFAIQNVVGDERSKKYNQSIMQKLEKPSKEKVDGKYPEWAGSGARALGRLVDLGMMQDKWDSQSEKILTSVMETYYTTNAEGAALLNSTGYRPIVHPVNDKYKEVFPKILEGIREKTRGMEIKEKERPTFDKLPSPKPGVRTMTYAGVGSRQTPPEVLAVMTKASTWLESLGYTLNTGKTFGGKEEGADKAFSDGTNKKNLFGPEEYGVGKTVQAVVDEIHPSSGALKDGARKLMARNTHQVFGENLDTPVDFVLYYADKDPSNPIRPKGGTGQAVEMANRKGIPTINMKDSDWRKQLLEVVKSKPKGSKEETQSPYTKEAKTFTANTQHQFKKENSTYYSKEVTNIPKTLRIQGSNKGKGTLSPLVRSLFSDINNKKDFDDMLELLKSVNTPDYLIAEFVEYASLLQDLSNAAVTKSLNEWWAFKDIFLKTKNRYKSSVIDYIESKGFTTVDSDFIDKAYEFSISESKIKSEEINSSSSVRQSPYSKENLEKTQDDIACGN